MSLGFVSYVGMRRTPGGTDTLHGENQREISPYPELRGTEKEAQEGRFGKVFIDGPMDAKTACDKHSGEIKGLSSPVVGNADILIFPNIESGNTFYKTLSLFGDANMAGMLTGTIAPVVVPSRSDSGKLQILQSGTGMSGRDTKRMKTRPYEDTCHQPGLHFYEAGSLRE